MASSLAQMTELKQRLDENEVMLRQNTSLCTCAVSTCSHLSASTLCSVPAWVMTCHCFRSSANSVVISFTRSRHLSFGLPRFHFPSTVICTCPNHLNLFSLRNSPIEYMWGLFPDIYICGLYMYETESVYNTLYLHLCSLYTHKCVIMRSLHLGVSIPGKASQNSVLPRPFSEGGTPCRFLVTPCPFQEAEMTPCPFWVTPKDALLHFT